MEPAQENPRNITQLAIMVEFSLAAIAIGVAWLLGRSPLVEGVDFSKEAVTDNLWAVLWGVLATVPMLALLPIIQRTTFPPLVRLREVVDEMIVPLFSETTVFQLGVIALSAGLGEEILFRSFVQTWVSEWGDPSDSGLGIWIGLIAASVAFGLCHWVTNTYAVLATGIGIYMGLLFIFTGNLIVPIVAHALYDFVALLYLVKWKRPASSAEHFDEHDEANLNEE